MTPVASALTKATVAGCAVVILLLKIRRAKIREPSWFGLTAPKTLPTVAFVLVYLAWMFASDSLIHWRGPWDFKPWRSAPLIASALRLAAVCILGPTAEELLFRGIIFSWLTERLNITLVILATAIGWAVLHWAYSWPVIGVIAIDGALLGLARWKTQSVLPPIVMHALYNVYAIW